MQHNHLRLKENRAEVEQCIGEYIHISKERVEHEDRREVLAENIKNAISSSDYGQAMDLAEELRDMRLGILWSRSRNKDGSHVLIRDARGRNDEPALDLSESYLIQGINSANAAKKILQHSSGITEEKRAEAEKALKDHLLDLTNNILDNPENKPDIITFNAGIKSNLIAMGIPNEQFNKQIQSAVQFGNLDKPQYHIVTLSKVEGKAVVESDIMMLGLTDKQYAQYRAINDSPGDGNIRLKIDGKSVDMEWYNSLPKFEKGVIRGYAQEIMDTGKCLPNQFKNMMVGLRNAYEKSVYIVNDTDDKSKLKLIQRVMHSGALSFHGKGDSQSITTENARQLKSFLEEDQHANVSVLVSPSNPLEKSIHTKVMAAQEELGGLSSTTPFNGLRLVSRNYTDGFQKTLDKLVEQLRKGDGTINNNRYDAVISFLENGKNEKAAREYIERDNGTALHKILEHAVNVKGLMQQSVFLRDPGNRNLQLVTEMSLLTSAMAQSEIYYNPMLVHCKSGKDRTGLAIADISGAAVAKEFMLEPKKKGVLDTEVSGLEMKEKVLTQLVRGGHTQFLSSVNGGTPGCHGIVSSSRSGFSRSWQKVDNSASLHQKSADFNSFESSKSLIPKWLRKIFVSIKSAYSGKSAISEESKESAFDYSSDDLIPRTGIMRDKTASKTFGRVPLVLPDPSEKQSPPPLITPFNDEKRDVQLSVKELVKIFDRELVLPDPSEKQSPRPSMKTLNHEGGRIQPNVEKLVQGFEILLSPPKHGQSEKQHEQKVIGAHTKKAVEDMGKPSITRQLQVRG